eukprot:6493210-Heterocapsa_arctica.AAC.1
MSTDIHQGQDCARVHELVTSPVTERAVTVEFMPNGPLLYKLKSLLDFALERAPKRRPMHDKSAHA